MAIESRGAFLGVQSKDSFLPFEQLVQGREYPFYVYDLDGIADRVESFKKSLGPQVHIFFAMKSNNNKAILHLMARLKIGADVVSGGEMKHAMACGISASQIVFSGVAKSKLEIKEALKAGVKQMNIESESELRRIVEVAKEMGVKAPVAFRLNPDVEASTHPYIRTGFRENKFGSDEMSILSWSSFLRENLEHLNVMGLSLHIGSQIRSLEPFKESMRKLKTAASRLEQELGIQLKTLDIGGGLGIDYHSSSSEQDFLSEYGKLVQSEFSGMSVEVLVEPGRILVARYGALLGRVEYIKTTDWKSFAILNTGMNHLMRPSLYQAYHRIQKIKSSGAPEKVYDVVGPICESSDTLGFERKIEQLNELDWVAILDTGAYGRSMSNEYNLHPLPEEVVVSRGKVL